MKKVHINMKLILTLVRMLVGTGIGYKDCAKLSWRTNVQAAEACYNAELIKHIKLIKACLTGEII
jgi:hypothetical protein